jgi:hypothetical protein
MFGSKQFKENPGYPTPETTPETTTCLILNIPDSAAWWAIYVGLLYTLTCEEAWQQFEDGMSREDAAAEALEIFWAAMDVAATTDTCVITTVPTPYWDADATVDDEAESVTQTWYGYVDDPEVAPEELTFVEQAAIWTFTGLLAVATIEVGAAPAILFNTVAPRFVLAVRRGEFAEIIRILIDGADAAKVDTAGYAAGDVIEIPIAADPELETHDILIIQES